MALKSPFPYAGGKSKVAHEVWARFGNINKYVEPFFGSGAVLLDKEIPTSWEVVNDIDGYIVNFWRCLKHKPEETAEWTKYPITLIDLKSRHAYIKSLETDLIFKLNQDMNYCNPQIGGIWVWGMCATISGTFNMSFSIPDTTHRYGVNRKNTDTVLWFNLLSSRLKDVIILNSPYSTCLGRGTLDSNGLCGIFLDPPYSTDHTTVYAHNVKTLSSDIFSWCRENGNNPQYRIALCGYEAEYEFPDSWYKFKWKSDGGYCKNGNNFKETIWFSPHCLKPRKSMFEK